MKTSLLRACLGAGVIAVGAQWTGSMRAAQPAAPKVHWVRGEISAVNASGPTVSMHRFLSTRTFHLANDCAITAGNNSGAMVSDLKPGMEVRVSYENADGVLVARKIAELEKTLTGSIKTVDPKAKELTLREGPFTHQFKIAEDCQFTGAHGSKKSMSDLEVGERVTLHYSKIGGALVAEGIAMPHETFVGTIGAIDPATDTVMAKNRKFNLASDCAIVLAGKDHARLGDLRVGERVAIQYRDIDGVWIASRIGPASAVPETAMASSPPRMTLP